MLLFGKSPTGEKEVSSIATMNALYRKSALSGQLFDEDLATGEDPEFNMRLVKRGLKLIFSEKLKVWHEHPVSLGGLIGKWYNYGKNYPIMCSKHSEFKTGAYYARISFMPLLVAFIALSLFNTAFAMLALLQVVALYAAYFAKGLSIGAGIKTPAFSGVHTIKQLAQLAGTAVGLKKLV
jgi:GT2 family glycosyltransferase